VKLQVEFNLDETDSMQWFPKITDVLGYATNLGFKDIKIKPEGYSIMKYGVKWEPNPLTDEEHQKLLKESKQYKNSKTNT